MLSLFEDTPSFVLIRQAVLTPQVEKKISESAIEKSNANFKNVGIC